MIGPITQGETGPVWTVTYLRADNTPQPITGATFTGVLYDLKTGEKKTLTAGNYTITSGSGGVFSYQPTSTDVNEPGLWGWESVLTIGGVVYKPRTTVQIDPAWGS